jgi:hypothetical protein
VLATIEAYFESKDDPPVLVAHAPTLPTHPPTGPTYSPSILTHPKTASPPSSPSCLQPNPAEATLRRAVLVPKESRP